MLYDVKCGRHNGTIESGNTRIAAKKFVQSLLEGDEAMGGCVAVTIPGGNRNDAMFFDTGGLIEEVASTQKFYQITLVA